MDDEAKIRRLARKYDVIYPDLEANVYFQIKSMFGCLMQAMERIETLEERMRQAERLDRIPWGGD